LDIELIVAVAKRKARGFEDDPFIDAAFIMAAAIRDGAFGVSFTIPGDGQPHIGDFGIQNYGELPMFAMEFHSEAQAGAEVFVECFKSSPREASSEIPHTTIAGASFKKGQWILSSEEEAKKAYSVDPTTGDIVPVEDGVVFSTIPEVLPHFLDKPKLPRVESTEWLD